MSVIDELVRRVMVLEGRASRLEVVETGCPVKAVRTYNSAAIAVADETPVYPTYDTDRWDNDNCHSVLSNTDRLTCVTAGLYTISAHVEWESNATGWRQVAIVLNAGTTYIAAQVVPAVNGAVTRQSVSTEYQLAVGDYVRVEVSQKSGGSLNIQAALNYSPEFAMTRIG